MQATLVGPLLCSPITVKQAAFGFFSLFAAAAIIFYTCFLNSHMQMALLSSASNMIISKLQKKSVAMMSRTAGHYCHVDSNVNKPILILMWVDYRDDHVTNEYLSSCGELNCRLTFDRQRINESSAVIFYDSAIDTMDLPSKPRLPHQHFVLLLMESAHHVSKVAFKILERHFYTLTMSYRRDSDLLTPYGLVRPRKKPLKTPYAFWKYTALSKPKGAVWIGSFCQTPSKREVYVEKLKQYMEVDIYGKCGNLKCQKTKTAYRKEDACEQMLKRNYKFYLAFENSVCKDFVTEKVFNRLDSHLVPVVFKRSIVEPLLPKGSFIAADDFKGPKQLADYLNYLSANWTAYVEYYKWKDFYEVVPFPRGVHKGMCQLCAKLRSDSCSRTVQPSKTAADVREWFIGQSECINDYGNLLTRQNNASF